MQTATVFENYLFMQEHSVNEWEHASNAVRLTHRFEMGLRTAKKPHTRQLNIIIEIKLNSINACTSWTFAKSDPIGL